ncbi:MAG: hypothetical protein NVSMB44_45750 [Ktedonobacteraceae bacterium]
MLEHDIQCSPLKEALAREPFVGDDGQGILVAGWLRLALALFGGHIQGRADLGLHAEHGTLLHDLGDAEIAEQHGAVAMPQHVFGLDIAMNDASIMRILQGGGQGEQIAIDVLPGHAAPSGVQIAQGAPGSVFQDQKGHIVATEAKVEHGQNMRVAQAYDARLIEEVPQVFAARELQLQDFDRYLALIVKVFSKVDRAEGSLAKLAYQSILADLLVLLGHTSPFCIRFAQGCQ